MDTKVCSKCETEQSVDEFNKKSTSSDGLQPYCRECNKEISRQYYKENREDVKQKIYAAKQKRVAKNKEKLLDILGSGCVDCGITDPRVLEFDHVRGEKEREIVKLTHDGYGWDTIEKELEKCEIRCANCHRIRTFEALDNCWRIF